MARILAGRGTSVQNLGAMKRRCWTGDDAEPLMLAYHDEEWGIPLHGDRELFAKLVLDGFQAGLSWRGSLHKRARLLQGLEGLDTRGKGRYSRRQIAPPLQRPGFVRHPHDDRAPGA